MFGFIAGLSSSGGSIKKTVDGGVTWTEVDKGGSKDILYYTVTFSDDLHGVASGTALSSSPEVYTSDGGSTFASGVSLDHYFASVVTDSGPIIGGGPLSFALVGAWGPLRGVGVTSDGGATWKHVEVVDPMGLPVAYGSFPSQEVWYVAGGTEPSTDAASSSSVSVGRLPHRLSSGSLRSFSDGFPPGSSSSGTPGYAATVMKTTDGGNTWSNVFSDVGRGWK